MIRFFKRLMNFNNLITYKKRNSKNNSPNPNKIIELIKKFLLGQLKFYLKHKDLIHILLLIILIVIISRSGPGGSGGHLLNLFFQFKEKIVLPNPNLSDYVLAFSQNKLYIDLYFNYYSTIIPNLDFIIGN